VALFVIDFHLTSDLRIHKPFTPLRYHQTDMPCLKRAKRSLGSQLPDITIPTHSSPSSPQPVTGIQFAIGHFIRQTVQLAFIAPPDISREELANTSTVIVTPAKSTIHEPPRTESPARSGPSNGSNEQHNPYAAIGGLGTTIHMPPTQAQQMRSAAYEGLKIVLQGLYDCSDMFLPLKTAAGVLMAMIKIVDVSRLVFG